MKMTRSATVLAVLAVAIWALAGVASAQQAPFPFGRCARSPGKSNYYIKSYRLNGDNGVCWTIGYSATCYRNDDPCCNRDLYKVMLETRFECATGTTVTGTIAGRALISTKVRFAVPPNSPSPGTDMTLNIADLDKDFDMTQTGYFATNSEVELCVAFSGTCSTLTEVLPSGRACEWDIAFWNRNRTTGDHHDCCPTFNYKCANPPPPVSPASPGSPSSPGNPSSPGAPSSPNMPSTPRSPSSPRSPRSPRVPSSPRRPRSPAMPNSPSVPSSPSSPASPPPPCLSCWVWIAEQLSNPDFRPYDDADICTAARNSIVEAMNNLNENQGGNAILSGFDAEGTQCDGNRVYSCGAFVSVEAGSAFVNELTTLFSPSEQISVGVPESLRNQACAPPGANFRLRGYTNEGGVPGVEVNDNSPADVCAPEADDACRVNSPPAPLTPSPPDTGFPFCACNKRPNATPFKLSELTEVVVGEDTGRSRTCFTVVANPDVDASLPCGRTTELLKMEFLLNYDNRRTMTDIYTSKDGETPQKRAQSWDNANGVLKVSPLGWTVDDLELNPRICFEFKDGFSLEDVLRTPGQMQYSAFDPTKGCCATNWYYSE